MTSSYVVVAVLIILAILAGLISWLVWKSHVKHRDVKRTNRRINQGH